MERLVKCHICGLRMAIVACKSCGKNVCEKDFDYSLNVCKLCAHGTS